MNEKSDRDVLKIPTTIQYRGEILIAREQAVPDLMGNQNC